MASNSHTRPSSLILDSWSSLIARRSSSAASLCCRTELIKSLILSSGDTFLCVVVGVSGAGVTLGSPALGKNVCCGTLVALPKEFGTLTGIGEDSAASRSCGEGFISRVTAVSCKSPGALATGTDLSRPEGSAEDDDASIGKMLGRAWLVPPRLVK